MLATTQLGSSGSSLSALPPNSIGLIGDDGSLRHPVALGLSPTGLAYGDGTLWVVGGTNGSVLRIDPTSRQVVDRIPVGRVPSAITVTGSDAWVANSSDGTVSRINAASDRVVDTIRVGAVPSALAAGPSGVWVANSGDDSIQRIDPATGVAGPAITVGARPDGISVTRDAVWVANGDDRSVLRIDPATGQSVGGAIDVGSGPSAIASVAGSIWVANTDSQSVDRVDIGSENIESHVLTGDGPSSIAVSGKSLWVGDSYAGTVTRVSLSGNAVQHFAVGGAPRALVNVRSSVWVAVGAFASTVHRGGELIVAARGGLPMSYTSIDPALSYLITSSWRPLRPVYDGLVAPRYGPGASGLSLVPDLATAIPHPSDGGRTYSFRIRSGVHFSDGTLVKASDIKRGVQRAMILEDPGFPGQARLAGIVGTDSCKDAYATCQLADGVVVDDQAGTVVFHLTKPNPDFLFRLSLFSDATVPSAPPTQVNTPLPSTGPYMVSSFVRVPDPSNPGAYKVTSLALSRNPYFRQWSFAAQPDGYPDTIRWIATKDYADSIQAVVDGRADLFTISGAGRGDQIDLKALQVEHPTQVHVDSLWGTAWFYLNTRVGPFRDIRVRQAVNFAVDRNRMAQLANGSPLVTPTCQLLPPDFPGYRPYCPYSTGPADAPYAGPNLARARQLVAASGTAGTSITVTGFTDPISHAVTSYLVGVLKSLGYRARPDYEDFIPDDISKAPIVESLGWLADYPAASNFYFAVEACDVDPIACNRTLDAQATAAHASEESDPAAAHQEWATIDRKATDFASLLPFVNLSQIDLVSARVGNYQSDPNHGVLLSQLWVK